MLAGLLVFIFLQNLHSLDSINQDIGRHLKTGEIIWQTHHVPRVNLFSYTEPDQPFINHHWLSEVLFYLIQQVVGLSGLIVVKALVITLAFGLVLWSLPRSTRLWPLLAAALVGWLAFFDRTDVRPEIFSYLYLAIFWLIISRVRRGGNLRLLYFLPLVELLWVNSHIYFILGPFLVLLLTLENKKYWPWLAAVSAATLVNPNFIHGALAPSSILRHYGYSIVENQSVWFLANYGILGRQIAVFELSLVVLAISFIFAAHRRQWRWFEFWLALALAVLGLKMIRNFGPYALLFVPIVAGNLSVPLEAAQARSVPLPLTGRTGIWSYAAAGVLLLLLCYLTVTNQISVWFQSAKRFGLSVPAGAAGGVQFIKQHHLTGPVFNNFDVGSYLIWQLYPEQRVFVDGRPEAYSVEFFENIYKPMQTDPAAWAKYSRQYGINYIFFDWHDITPWAQQFLARISRDPAWPLAYRDDWVVIFLKRPPKP